MKLRTSYLIIVVLTLLLFITVYMWINTSKLFTSETRESSDVLLEEVARVFKLIAIEGQVAEIYNYKDHRYWDVPFLSKEALIRVKATVSVGYDFEDVEFIVDESNYTIRIKEFPEAEILAIDHDLDYYNMREGMFNTFTAAELSRMNDKARSFIEQKVKEGRLFDEAEAQKDILLDMLGSIFERTGWTLEVEDKDWLLQG